MCVRPVARMGWGIVALGWLAIAGGVAAGETPFLAYGTGGTDVVVTHRGEEYLRLRLVAWGPNWAWTGMQGEPRNEAGAAAATFTGTMGGTGVPFQIAVRAGRPQQDRLHFEYRLAAEADTELTAVVVELVPGRTFHGREVVVTAQGEQRQVPCPFERRGLGSGVETVAMTDAAGGSTVLRFDPPAEITSDGAARIALAAGRLAGGETKRLALTVALPAATAWYPTAADLPAEPGIDAWYPWEGSGGGAEGVLAMDDWFDAPAGRHGRIVAEGDRLVYDGRPIKLWGLNVCFAACAPERALAQRRAAFYRRHGINSVRLHKYADGPGWAGILSPESFVAFDAEALDRMDYFVAQLKEAGIYVKLSAHFGAQKLGPAEIDRFPFIEEFGRTGNDRRVTTPHSAVHYSPELQALQAEQMVNLLQHRNPYTGLTYAEDPAIAFVEIINEQSILFYTSMAPLSASPTLRRQVAARFCQWLRARYGSHEGLRAAWGERAFDSFAGELPAAAGEHLDKENILPLGNPWYWDPDQLAGSQAFRRQRLLDTLEFLYDLQNDFYDGFVAAVRGAGYEGEIVASNWQAGRALSHFANLHSDHRVGTIDRHNYFGGDVANASMLARAGSGMLSSGLQQTAGRPFMLSEWIHVHPNEMGAEGPAILGAYGMGLQGWDVSYMFQNRDDGGFSNRIGRDQWDVTAPQVLGLFPAVSRQVLRGDVREAEAVAVRNVHVPSLFAGELGFDDRVEQGHDVKELDSSHVPAAALAVVRNLVDFTAEPAETEPFDLTPYRRAGGFLASTGQLHWREADEVRGGRFLVNTPATKAVVGFARGEVCRLGAVTIEPQSPFAAIYVTARSPQGTIAEDGDLLIVALARARNTGMTFSPDGRQLLEQGSPPILIEPVKARITVARPGTPRLIHLDHDGRATDRTIPVEDGSFTIDGARDRTPYYLLRYAAPPAG